MLQFVHLSGSAAGKDLQTRRKVRSQAMRDFRRRQRAEREAGRICAVLRIRPTQDTDQLVATQTGKPQSGATTPKSAKSRVQSRERSVSGGSSAEAECSRRNSERGMIPTSVPMSYASQESSFQIPSTQAPPIVLFDDMSGDIEPHWGELAQSQSEPTQWLPGLMGKTSSIPRAPSAWGNETEDPFQSPAQIGQMFGFCKSCALTATVFIVIRKLIGWQIYTGCGQD